MTCKIKGIVKVWKFDPNWIVIWWQNIHNLHTQKKKKNYKNLKNSGHLEVKERNIHYWLWKCFTISLISNTVKVIHIVD